MKQQLDCFRRIETKLPVALSVVTAPLYAVGFVLAYLTLSNHRYGQAERSDTLLNDMLTVHYRLLIAAMHQASIDGMGQLRMDGAHRLIKVFGGMLPPIRCARAPLNPPEIYRVGTLEHKIRTQYPLVYEFYRCEWTDALKIRARPNWDTALVRPLIVQGRLYSPLEFQNGFVRRPLHALIAQSYWDTFRIGSSHHRHQQAFPNELPDRVQPILRAFQRSMQPDCIRSLVFQAPNLQRLKRPPCIAQMHLQLSKGHRLRDLQRFTFMTFYKSMAATEDQFMALALAEPLAAVLGDKARTKELEAGAAWTWRKSKSVPFCSGNMCTLCPWRTSRSMETVHAYIRTTQLQASASDMEDLSKVCNDPAQPPTAICQRLQIIAYPDAEHANRKSFKTPADFYLPARARVDVQIEESVQK